MIAKLNSFHEHKRQCSKRKRWNFLHCYFEEILQYKELLYFTANNVQRDICRVTHKSQTIGIAFIVLGNVDNRI